jgi:hypothetical protein
MSPNPPDDKRRAPRLRFPCDVRGFAVGESLIQPHIVDLSQQGAFIETVSSLPLRTNVILKFHVPAMDLKIEAEVVREEVGHGLGVRFVRLTPAQEAAIEQTLAGLDA